MLKHVHMVMAGIVAAMSVLTMADILPPQVTTAAALIALLAHAVEAGIDGAEADSG